MPVLKSVVHFRDLQRLRGEYQLYTESWNIFFRQTGHVLTDDPKLLEEESGLKFLCCESSQEGVDACHTQKNRIARLYRNDFFWLTIFHQSAKMGNPSQIDL